MTNRIQLHDRLILMLLKRELNEVEKQEVENIIFDINFNWELFLGKVCFNRVNGMVFRNIRNFTGIPREVKLILEMLNNAQIEKIDAHKSILKEIADAFEVNEIRYAFIKGSVLNNVIYPMGTRISNDIDILVSPKQLRKVEKLLSKLGYVQGSYNPKSDDIKHASLAKKLYIRMNTHEVQSFVRLEENKFIHVNTVDINFKLSANDSVEVTEYLLDNTCVVSIDDFEVKTLGWDYFFVQLSKHLWREAMSASKILSSCDMHFYKYYDFYMLLTDDRVAIDWQNVIEIAEKSNQLKSVYYALYSINQLFPGIVEDSIFEMFNFEDTRFLDEYMGNEKKDEVFYWNEPFLDRFFDYSRKTRVDQKVIDASEEYKRNVNNI
ncbi:MAG: nucleotidyltransferase family protein [Lachnospiraceae bacterium]|nr:nucleotidyltransferase family protein [Lachnospiraceae bacterium]